MSYRNRIIGYGEVPPDQLLANPDNWRVHPRLQHDALDSVLKEIGWVQDVIVNQQTGNMVDGHLRAILADEAGMELVPVKYVDLTLEEERAILATFDPLGALAARDNEKLTDLLADVRESHEELAGALSQIHKSFRPERAEREAPEARIDQAERLLEKWKVQPGQKWLIPSLIRPGCEHVLVCGDATNPEDVASLFADLGEDFLPALMITDPPYGVDYDASWRDEYLDGGNPTSERRVGKVGNDDRTDWLDAWLLFPGDVVYTWALCGGSEVTTGEALQRAGFVIRNQVIWKKPHFPMGRGHYGFQYEPCWYAVRKGANARWIGDLNTTNVWEIGLDKNVEGGHATQKPLECMKRPMRNHTGDVYDPFIGSGTTMVAAEQVGRLCYGLEIEPKYVAVVLERMSEMGLQPICEGRELVGSY